MESIYGITGNVFMDKNMKRTLSFVEFFKILQRNWMIVLISFVSFVLTVGTITFKSKPVYEASATLSFNEAGEGIEETLFEPSNITYPQNFVMNQVVILKSHRIAIDVINRLMESAYKDSLNILGLRRESPEPISIVEKISSLLFKKDTTQNVTDYNHVVKNYQKSIKVSYGENKDMVELKAVAFTPFEAAYLVNTWIDVYLEYTFSGNKGETIQTKELLEKELTEASNNLIISEERLRGFQKGNDVISLSTGAEQLVSKLTEFEFLYNETRAELEAVNDQLNYLNNQLDESKRNLVDNVTKLSNSVLETLQTQMADLVAKKAAFEAQLISAGISTEGNLQLAQMEGRLQGLKDKIVEETKKLIDTDYSQLNPLDYSEKLIDNILEKEIAQKSLIVKTLEFKKIIDDYSNKLEILPDMNLELARLERDVQLNSKVYSTLREKYEDIKIREATQMQGIRIIDRATPPLDPIRPNKRLIMMLACFFGSCFSIALAMTRDYFQDVVRNGEDVKRMGLNIIGEIPLFYKVKAKHKYKNQDPSIERARMIFPNILYQQNGHSVMSEVYRTIRTALTLHSREKNIRTILFTSPGPSEGKSTTIANLAISMARKGTKTLLIDADLRKPVMDTLFLGSPRKLGLTNLINKKMKLEDVIRETSIRKLHLLAAGTAVHNAPELLSSRLMQFFLQQAKKDYAIILIDSPPILPVTDANILASLVDGVVLVIKSGQTSRKDVQRSFDLLNRVKCHHFGTVITEVKETNLYEYKQYYTTQKK